MCKTECAVSRAYAVFLLGNRTACNKIQNPLFCSVFELCYMFSGDFRYIFVALLFLFFVFCLFFVSGVLGVFVGGWLVWVGWEIMLFRWFDIMSPSLGCYCHVDLADASFYLYCSSDCLFPLLICNVFCFV